jgi:hypothetical protein
MNIFLNNYIFVSYGCPPPRLHTYKYVVYGSDFEIPRNTEFYAEVTLLRIIPLNSMLLGTEFRIRNLSIKFIQDTLDFFCNKN